MIILGIETSCDETAVAIVEATRGTCSVRANIVSSQVALHAQWGGVVPNLAAREHLKNIGPVFQAALHEAQLGPNDINLITVTNGPGLIPALLIGTSFARSIAYAWQKPLIGIHHIEGHIYANFIGKRDTTLKFPILALVVSGGHTQLILMRDYLRYEIVGETLDDAVGEAFDKVARILGLGYPGGPAVARLVTENKSKVYDVTLPRPMFKSKNFNFSFSGLKTAVLYETKKHPELLQDKTYLADVAHEFQQAVIDVLISKTLAAAQKYNPKMILLAGGVSANQELRKQLGEELHQKLKDTSYIIPRTSYSVDNAAMIATAGYYRWQRLSPTEKSNAQNTWKTLSTEANLPLL